MINRRGQEEMVGFAVILIIVAVIMVFVLSFMLRKDSNSEIIKSSEVGAFIGSILKYTSDCESYIGFTDVQDLIPACYEEDICLDGRNSCEVLNLTVMGLVNSSWRVNQDSPVKGYRFRINVDNNTEMFTTEQGNTSSSYLSNYESFTRSGRDYQVYIRIYN